MKQSYIPKDLTFDNEGRSKLISGITKISKAVKSTLGPRGRTVLIESPDHIAGITVTKDGVTVDNSIFLDDPIENLAIQMMKDAASRTAQSAGDGTTTAIVLTEAIVNAGQKYLTKDHNVTEVIKHINKFSKELIKILVKDSKKITKSRLLDVATISANNDKEIGSIIAEAYNKVGVNGIVTVEKSMNHETYAEVTNGIKIDRGYTSNLFLNNQRKDECILEDVMVLVCDQEISNILQIENILKPIIQQNKKLLIIAPCATSPGEVVTNGWSPSRRNYKTSNSGIVVELKLKDFSKYDKHGPLSGMYFQKDIEQSAFKIAGETQKVPAQRLVDFINNKKSSSIPKTSYFPGTKSVELRSLFPNFLSDNLNIGFQKIGNKMKGYLTNEAVVHAPESRTSSPVRIPRDKISLQHPQVIGLFPCGEGAGYAGGIISAAIDGQKCARSASVI